MEPRREGYYGPQHGSVSWVAPKEGVYAFADPIEQNCWAGMLLVVDVERPEAAAAPAPAPSKAGAAARKNDNYSNDNNNKKKKPAAGAVVPAAAPAPAPAAAASAAAASSSVSVASVGGKAPEPVSPQAAIEEPSFVEGEPPPREMTPRERHAARVAERESARAQHQMERAIEEGRVDFEGSQQHVIED